MEERNDIVIYQSEDGLVKMEAMVDPAGETIWATQKAIAALFGVTIPNVSYHFRRILESGELKRDKVIKEYLNTAQSDARGLSEEKVMYYKSGCHYLYWVSNKLNSGYIIQNMGNICFKAIYAERLCSESECSCLTEVRGPQTGDGPS